MYTERETYVSRRSEGYGYKNPPENYTTHLKRSRNEKYTIGWDLFLGEKLCKTCLLYTSPSPRDKRQSRMPSSA